MKIPLASYIKAKVEWSLIDDLYKSYLKELSKNTGEWGVDRDGDIFQISCPVCKTKKINQAYKETFVCSKKHVFSVYPEDGIRPITGRNDGDDLQKDGKDAHGHGLYLIHKPDEKTAVYLQYWVEGDISLPDVSNKIWELKKNFPITSCFNFNIGIDTMSGGQQIAELNFRVNSWPKYVNNKKWFVLIMGLKNQTPELNKWALNFLEYCDR